MSYQEISLEIQSGSYLVGMGFNQESSMTVLTEKSLSELSDVIDLVAQDKKAKNLIIFSHSEKSFIAGMDIKVIQSLKDVSAAVAGCEKGQSIFNKIEDLKVDTWACVNGVCLGGGLELALSCKYIIASEDAKLGLPEVMLGVLPGFGGTYRLPKRIGLTSSLDLILTGKQLRAVKAKKMGLVDMIVAKEKLVDYALSGGKVQSEHHSLSENFISAASENFVARKVIFQKAREKVLKSTKGFYPAPLKILDHLESSFGKKRSTYLAAEARAFGELSQTVQSKNLQHVFFLHDNSKKYSYSGNIKKIKRGSVLGAGTMGGGIAWLFANNDQAPVMKDINDDGLLLGLKQSASVFSKALKRKRISFEEFNRKQRSIQPTKSFATFKQVDLVVEAVVENMDVKKKVLAQTESYLSQDALLTTNTSSLSVEDMASALERPQNFAGLHFFNPVDKMPLVEIIKHKNVSQETIYSLYQWALDVKKTPIIVNDCPGFLVNRILAPFLNEAAYLLEEGVAIERLDKAVLNFGMPMGACRLMDEIGLDVCAHVGEVMEKGLGQRAKANSLSHVAVEAGLLGKKSGSGFYLYDDKGKETQVNPKIVNILPKQNIDMDERKIQMRLFLPMINEAAMILDEKIVDGPSTVDLGLIFGIGFPPFRGGLLRYADSEGIERIASAIERFASEVSKDRYQLSTYLKKMAQDNQTFYKY